MKKICTLAIALTFLGLGFVVVNGCKKKTVEVKSGKIISADKTSYQEVTSKLDPGGDFYLYLGTEKWLENLSGKIASWRGAIDSIPDLQDQRENVGKAFDIVTRVIKDSGIEDVSGIGVSSIARESDFYYSKTYVHHYSDKGNGFIWTLFGKEPHELSGLDLLPVNTAMASFCDMDVAQAWSIVQKQGELSGFPQAAEFLNKLPEEFEKNTGMKWKDVVNSFGGEFGLVITLDESKMVKLPIPQQPLEIPEPGFMLIAKTKNDAIFDKIDESIKKNRQRGIIHTDKDGLRMLTQPIPLPLPISLRPSIATSEGYLFIASSDALIKEALAVKGGKPGLKSTVEFKHLATDLPQNGNQFVFLSQRFGQTIMKVQQQAMEMNKGMPPGIKEMVQPFLQPEKAGFIYSVGANTDEGWITIANGNQSGGKVFLASTVAVPAMIAAIAIPNFVKARQTAQSNVCINNLRMINGAKQQWALEQHKTLTAIPTWTDLQPYLGRPGSQQLRCPQGGQYTLGSVGESPHCSIPGHALP